MARRPTPLKEWNLNLGCGSRPEPGWINHDRERHSPYVDVAWDLELERWPHTFCDMRGGFGGLVPQRMDQDALLYDRVRARDVLEHIPPNLFFRVMGNIWKLLAPGGVLEVQVPEWGSENALIDPSHYRGFHLDSFDILDPTTPLGRRNAFYRSRPWKLMSKSRVPRSRVNLSFVLQKAEPISSDSQTPRDTGSSAASPEPAG